MSTSELVLPPDAERIVRAAFGNAALSEVSVVRGGRSGASVFCARIAAQSYVIRVPNPEREQHHERSEREITSMTLAAQRGISPELCHADRATGITISHKIERILMARERALAPGRIARLASTVRAVHEGPQLPEGASVAALLSYFDGVLHARGAGGIPTALAAALRDATEASSRFGKHAPCHGDLNPSNVLETAERAYLVDWETAGQGDPFVDLGQLGVFSLFAPGAREELLAAYLGRSPNADEEAHATLARVIALGFYAVSFITGAVCSGATVPDESQKPRPVAEIIPDLAQGKESTGELAASLQHATLQEAGSDAYRAAKQVSLGS